MRRTLALVTAVTLSISAACGDDSSDAGDGGSATGEPGDAQETELSTDLAGWEIIEESSTEPFTVDEPIWGSDSDDAAQFVTNAALHDDWAVLLGGDADMAARRLEVVDLAAGELSWGLDEFVDDELPGGDGARLWLPSGSDPATHRRRRGRRRRLGRAGQLHEAGRWGPAGARGGRPGG